MHTGTGRNYGLLGLHGRLGRPARDVSHRRGTLERSQLAFPARGSSSHRARYAPKLGSATGVDAEVIDLGRYIATNGLMGSCPDWYELACIADRLHCPMWELVERSIFWRDLGRKIKIGRAHVNSKSQSNLVC